MKNFIFIFLIFGSLASQAKILAPEVYLSKISQRLTGAWPTPREYEALAQVMKSQNCSEISCLQSYFRQYIQNKMKTAEFYSEATLKVFEKFAFQTPLKLPFPLRDSDYYSRNSRTESLLVYRVFHENMSIDELFLSQIKWDTSLDLQYPYPSYSIETDESVPSTVIDIKKFAGIELQVEQKDYTGHPNVAGLLSSEKFLTRYWNTAINGNRKRAAAIFKTMLCNSMSPALERNQAKQQEENLATGKTEASLDERTIEEIHKNRHANQSDCAKCHNLLDPMARTLRPLDLGVSNIGTAGRLRYTNSLNQAQDKPVKNYHELIKTITQTEDYVNCQMNWLFNWIVGKDVQIHPQRFADLLDGFERDQRKVKNVIETLLLSPEFQGQTVQYDEPASLAPVRAILSNCTECHKPFLNARGEELKGKLYKISTRLDLKNEGRDRTMPPKSHWWAPSKEELKALKSWIQEGAPLVRGKPMLNKNEIQSVLNPKVEVAP